MDPHPPRHAAAIRLSAKQQQILESWARGSHTALHWKHRAQIILEAAAGWSNRTIAQRTQQNRNTVKKWRNRWAQVAPEIDQQETSRPWELARTIAAVLDDAPRPGKPCRFTPEQVAQIIP